jgi:hypothetical protein
MVLFYLIVLSAYSLNYGLKKQAQCRLSLLGSRVLLLFRFQVVGFIEHVVFFVDNRVVMFLLFDAFRV